MACYWHSTPRRVDPAFQVEPAMSFLTKAQSTVYLGLVCFQILSAGENTSYHRHRVPLSIPVSDPFVVTDAVRLPEWSQIRRMTELIKTDRGSLDLLHEMPQVEAKYGNASYFLDLIQKWRDRIPILPKTPDSDDENDSSWVVLENGQSRTISITFRHEIPENSVSIMRVTWVDKQITNLTFSGGFDNVLPQRNRHRKSHN
jgi:hypothetical protein